MKNIYFYDTSVGKVGIADNGEAITGLIYVGGDMPHKAADDLRKGAGTDPVTDVATVGGIEAGPGTALGSTEAGLGTALGSTEAGPETVPGSTEASLGTAPGSIEAGPGTASGITADLQGLASTLYDAMLNETPLIQEAAKQLKEYLKGKRKAFDLPLAPEGTPFQKAVWQALTGIPYGETRTYREIAETAGKPKACRAVGMANNKNPIAILIPCHRVIGADGKLTGYAGGLDIKEKLLGLENMGLENMGRANRNTKTGSMASRSTKARSVANRSTKTGSMANRSTKARSVANRSTKTGSVANRSTKNGSKPHNDPGIEAIKEQLRGLADEKYREFSAGLVPDAGDMLGVRLPALRKLGKELSKGNWRDYLSAADDEFYEEIMLQGIIIGLAKTDIEESLRLVAGFIPKIGNWGVCDSFCAGLGFVKRNKPRVWEFLMPYFDSDKEFELRFAAVMLLFNFIDGDHINAVLKLLNGIRHKGYYVKMAVAWALSVCYVKFPGKTTEYLQSSSLDDFTYNKALQKVIESNRVGGEAKNFVRSLKRK